MTDNGVEMQNTYYQAQISTPLGHMIAIASENTLLLLEFADCKILDRKIKHLKQSAPLFTIIPGKPSPITCIEGELKAWFSGDITVFTTPLAIRGTPFQEEVWNALCTIPYGETRSYLQQATLIGREKSCRAVANSNAANKLAIVIPCHRIINTNGALGGYAGGVDRKRWLLDHEKATALSRCLPLASN